ncbi:MAG: FUSC family protein [Oxalobacter formigenes]|nr:FUSC family protein [Oxalobacter formigenes]
MKAALSVFICCLIYEFFYIGTGVPFYSGIASVICLQPEIKSTFRVGLNRTIGTLIGGLTGMVVLFIIRELSIFRLPALKYLLISLCILPLMYIAEAVKKNRFSAILQKRNDLKKLFSIAPLVFLADFMRKSALTNITCIAFLSVTITHGTDLSIFNFAFNRILDTLIGVFVSFFVNIIPLGRQGKPSASEENMN